MLAGSPPRPHAWSHARVLGTLLATLVAAGATAACGHPATEAECQLLVDRNVELQVASMTAPPADLEKEKQRVRDEMQPALKGCVGRRITDRMLRCVRTAKTVKEVDECMR